MGVPPFLFFPLLFLIPPFFFLISFPPPPLSLHLIRYSTILLLFSQDSLFPNPPPPFPFSKLPVVYRSRGYQVSLTYPLFTPFPKSGSFWFTHRHTHNPFHSMPEPSPNHYREDSLYPDPSVPDSALLPSTHFRAASSTTTTTNTTNTTTTNPSSPPTTDPPATSTTFSGSVVGSISRRNRRSFAALAQKTTSALASLSTISTISQPPTYNTPSTLRSSNSSGSLSKLTRSSTSTPLTPPLDGDPYEQLPASRSVSPEPSSHRRRLTLQRAPTPPHDSRLPSGAAPIAPAKMHQTSSRLLRMTEDERPFTKVGFGDERLAIPRTERKRERAGTMGETRIAIKPRL